ncbi:response regulator [Nodosilinea sp. FACHB-131]|uniref:response regulator n=1 Tax=Cyanophyceae TaxID=3028117 RepID=UPI00168592FB|nr:response regulator [Nodosilinea sp. FACHB-131]MBD1875593.1 response regulator [Nodosilinea sp. FACHB-131]
MNTEHTILLVEDNPKDVFLVQRAARKAGIITPLQVVSDGDAAVGYLSGDAPYGDRAAYPLPVLVLLDLKLPRRSGAEVLSWIRQHPHFRRLPVVVLTSSREFADINHIYDLGANAYIVKPADFDQLVDILTTLNLHWITYNEKPQLDMDMDQLGGSGSLA